MYFYPISQLDLLSVSPEDLQTLGASSLWLFRPQIKIPFMLSANRKTDSIICCRALCNQGSGRLEYAYFILMDTADFSEMLTASFSNTDTCGYLALPDGTIIASSEPELYGRALSSDFLQTIESNKNPYFVHEDSYIHASILDNGWYQITDIPKRYITDSTAVLLRAILLTLLIALPATILIVLLISRSLSVKSIRYRSQWSLPG